MLSSAKLTSFASQYNKLVSPSISESIFKQQQKISDLLSLTGISTATIQSEKLLRGFDNSFLKSINQQQETLKNSFLSASSLNTFIDGRLRISDLASSQSWSSIARKHSLLNTSVFDSFKTTSQILSNLHSVSSVLNNIEQNKLKIQIFKNIEDSFSIQLLRGLKYENIDFNDAVEVVEEAFSNKINELPKSWVSFEGMIQLFFAFAFLIYSQSAALDSEDNILERMKELEANLINQISLLIPETEEESKIYYIVKRTVNLRANSSTKSPVLGVLYPNQRVELIERKSKWIYVEYFDNLNGIPRMGWVYKKYLKMESK